MQSLGTNGRLGNQLFQYAVIRAVSHKLGLELKIPNPNHQSWHSQECLLKYFNIKCQYLNNDDIKNIQHTYSEINGDIYDDKVFSVNDNTDFYGFFQSSKYFEDIEDILKNDLIPIPLIYDYAKKYIENIKLKYGQDCEIVSIHIRRGDLITCTGLEHFYGVNNLKIDEDSVYGKYLKKAMQLFENNKNVIYLIFTGGSRHGDINGDDISWCKENFTENNMIFSEGNSSIQDFAIMTMCDHNILGYGTTFSWWAAYLNNNKNKKIIGPENIFICADDKNRVRTNFYTDKFTLI